MASWRFLPTICFEACIENPFVLDLMRSETFVHEAEGAKPTKVDEQNPDSISQNQIIDSRKT